VALKGYPTLMVLFLLFVLSSAICPAPETKIPFPEYGDAYVEAAGHPDLKRDEKALEIVLNDSYVAVKLGLFDVWHPRMLLRERDIAKRFKSSSEALLDLQDRWIAWVADEEVKKECLDDIKILRKWVRSWKVNKIPRRKNDEKGRPDLLDILDAKESISAASRDFENLMVTAKCMKRENEEGKNVFIVMAPTRRNFIELAGFMGSLNETNKALLWGDRTATWTTFTCGPMHVIALEYPAAFSGKDDITEGVDMNGSDKTGLLQHVVLNASMPLIAHYHRDGFSPGLVNGLAMNMVIEMFKQISVRSGSGSKGGRVAGSSAFVPGGRSSGGVLAGNKAKPMESRWRNKKGKDHFLAMLKSAQNQGAKDAAKAKNRNLNHFAFFALKSDAGAGGYTARAPFLMEAEGRDPVPKEYADDFNEFLRAYQCAFAYWLMNKAKNPEKSLSSSDLLKRFLQDGSVNSVEGIYGLPLTGADHAADSLEKRFLVWLAK
jgi:hypothetical protein